MDKLLNLPSLNLIGQPTPAAAGNRMPARSHVAAAVLIFLAAGLGAEALGARAPASRLPEFHATVGAAIAQQGNAAVRRIRAQARRSALAAQPVPLSELVRVGEPVALAAAR